MIPIDVKDIGKNPIFVADLEAIKKHQQTLSQNKIGIKWAELKLIVFSSLLQKQKEASETLFLNMKSNNIKPTLKKPLIDKNRTER